MDIWVKYDHDSNEFYINTYSSNFVWEPITNGDTIIIWEFKEVGSPSTGKFEPYAPENLIVINYSGSLNLT